MNIPMSLSFRFLHSSSKQLPNFTVTATMSSWSLPVPLAWGCGEWMSRRDQNIYLAYRYENQ